MDKKSQTLIVSLWILVILTILAVGIGHRVSMALRLSRYQRDKLRAFYLAKAGINRAIIELEKDTNSYDALNELWANNEDVFKKIVLNYNQTEFATVSYEGIDEHNNTKTIYGAMDVERKININIASKELLLSLLEKCKVDATYDIVNNILIWRGDIPDDNKIYENLGYPCKANKLSNIEELKLVKGITPQDYQKLKGMISAYGDNLINVNTVSSEVLNILAHSIAQKLSIEENFADSVAAKIIELKKSKGFFKEKNDIAIMLTGDEEVNIFNDLLNNIIFKSDNFLIEVTGNVSKIESKITIVYNRKNKKVLYWHEN